MGECYDSSDNECGARRGVGPHAAWGRGDVLREFYCAHVAYTHYNEHFNSKFDISTAVGIPRTYTKRASVLQRGQRQGHREGSRVAARWLARGMWGTHGEF